MTAIYPKRLIEVDLPIKRISAHARREKSIRHGHISTLHIWWARRPLAACRAVICAALWPDPVDELCPEAFRVAAARLMNGFARKAATDQGLYKHCSPENWSKWQTLAKVGHQLDPSLPHHWNILRNCLLDFIADFANWDNSTQPDYLETSRALTQAAHEALGGIPGTRPLVVDPFAGGGSIPLEALRVGADAFASDLNPVAVLLNKVVLEYIPKYGQRLADEVRKWGQWVKEEAEKELGEFYPKDPDGSTPIAYLWARTIICEGPGCGAEVPLMRSLWLAKKSNRSIALQFIPSSPQPPSPQGEGGAGREGGSGNLPPLSLGRGAGGEGQDLSALAGKTRQIPRVLLERAKELRQNQTPAEQILWECLRDRRLCDAKFRRQHNIGQIIADFYCHTAKLIVEVDGQIHEQRQTQDHDRDRWATDHGFKVLRFTNEQVWENLETVLGQIAEAIDPSSPQPPSPQGEGGAGNLSPLSSGRGAGGDALQFIPSSPQPPSPQGEGGAGNLSPLSSGRGAGGEGKPHVNFRIIQKQGKVWVDQADPSWTIAKPDLEGTVKRGSGTCPCCGFTTPVASVRKQLKPRKGGANDARLFCVVVTKPGEKGRFYRLPMAQDLVAVERAKIELEKREKEHQGELSLVPDEPYPDARGVGALSSSVTYGFETWGDIFTNRQLLALTTLGHLVREVGEKLEDEDDRGLAIGVQSVLAISIDRIADISNSLCQWKPSMSQAIHLFTRQAIPMLWDFAETSQLSDAAGDIQTTIVNLARILDKEVSAYQPGTIERSDSTQHPLSDDFAQCFFSDPPYYDAIAYADLSDFFYVWLKRNIGKIHPDLFSTQLVDKTNEIVHLSKRFRGVYDHKTEAYFEENMQKAMAEGRRILTENGIGVVVFAHKSTSGWEAQLQAMVDAGWIVTGSWAIDTEMGNRMNAMNAATLASSVHLVCRPRSTNEIGDWRDVLQELPQRIQDWMPRLAREGVVGADAIFACLGPALEIFSRYSSVEKANGDIVTLREYLEQVWATVSQVALSMIFDGIDASGLEPDARLTAMWLWTLSTGSSADTPSEDSKNPDPEDKEEGSSKPAKVSGYSLEYDAARKIAQGLGVHLEKLSTLVAIKGSQAMLLAVGDRTRYLFGKDEVQQAAVPKKTRGKSSTARQLTLTSEDMGRIVEEVTTASAWTEGNITSKGETVLDRVHQSMILFATGRSDALKRFIVEGGVGNDDRYWRLAQSLSALYPPASQEKRWVDGVLARKKNLGF